MELVKNSPEPTMESFSFSDKMQRVSQSPLLQLMSQASGPGVLSLALGSPDGGMFPGDRIGEASSRVLSHSGVTQYGQPHVPLKTHIVRLMTERGVRCTEEQIFLTAGAQQGLSLLTQLLLDPGSTVIAEDTIYDCLQMVLKSFDARILTVPTSFDTGMDLDSVEALLGEHRPAFIYVIPDGHNPLGISMSPTSRRRLVQLGRRYQVPVIEDDAYGFLSYESMCPSLRALDERWVFYLGSFSKTLAPSLRLGWIVVPSELTPRLEELTSKLSILKQASDFDTSTFVQRAVASYLDMGEFGAHLEILRDTYRERRDAMVSALERHLPPNVVWRAPECGFFVWVELPPECDAHELLKIAVETEKVSFVPGAAFSLAPSRTATQNCIRLSFGNATIGEIEEGVTRLGRALDSVLADFRGRAAVA